MIHRCIVVPSDKAVFAASLTAKASPSGVDMFKYTLISEEEQEYKFSNGKIGVNFAELLPLYVWEDEAGYTKVNEGSAETISSITGAPIEEVQELLDVSMVTTEDWVITASRMGLKYKDV